MPRIDRMFCFRGRSTLEKHRRRGQWFSTRKAVKCEDSVENCSNPSFPPTPARPSPTSRICPRGRVGRSIGRRGCPPIWSPHSTTGASPGPGRTRRSPPTTRGPAATAWWPRARRRENPSVICCRCSPGSWRIPPRRHCIFRRPRPWAPISSPPHANSPSMRCVGDVAAGRRQAMNPATCTPCRSRPTTGTPRRTCGGRCAKVRGGSSPTRTCCTSACSPGTSGGRGCCGSWSTSSSTSATPTAGSSAPTSRWSCGACCAWPATTARTPRWCSPPRRRPIRRRRPRG